MQLTYRGIAHALVPSVPATCKRQEVPARYRGLEWSWPAQSVAVALPQSFAFMYRGVALQSETKVTAGIPEVQASRTAGVSPPASSRKHFIRLAEETHRQNLLRRLQERIRSAQARGDEYLLQQLEQERQLLA